jgi:hypothetical protein
MLSKMQLLERIVWRFPMAVNWYFTQYFTQATAIWTLLRTHVSRDIHHGFGTKAVNGPHFVGATERSVGATTLNFPARSKMQQLATSDQCQHCNGEALAWEGVEMLPGSSASGRR